MKCDKNVMKCGKEMICDEIICEKWNGIEIGNEMRWNV